MIGTMGHYLLFLSLHYWFEVHAVAASTLGAALGALINYFLSYYFVFRSDKGHKLAMTKFFVIAGIGLLLNSALMAFGVVSLGVEALVAQVAATVIVLAWNFTANRLWTFRA